MSRVRRDKKLKKITSSRVNIIKASHKSMASGWKNDREGQKPRTEKGRE